MGTEMANSEYNNYPTIMSSFVQSVEQINEGLTSLTLSNDCFVISNSLRRLCTDCVALTMIATVAPYLRLIHEKKKIVYAIEQIQKEKINDVTQVESVCSSVSEMIGMVGDLKDLTNEQIDLVTMEKNVLEQTTLNAIQTINNAITNKQDIFPLLSSIKENNNLRVIIDKDVGFNEQYNKVMNEKYPHMDALKQKNQKQQKVTEDVLTKDDKKDAKCDDDGVDEAIKVCKNIVDEAKRTRRTEVAQTISVISIVVIIIGIMMYFIFN
ncbi:Transmembrane protein [Entamoeba marina]